MERIALTLPAALMMGLSFGAGPCNITCLPYLGPVFLAREGGLRQSWRTVAPFSAGRLAGYGALGGVAGLLGHTLQAWLQSPAVHWLLGAATILVGFALLLRRKKPKGCAPHPAAHNTRPLRQRPCGLTAQPAGVMLPGGLFLMGAGMALNPCAPLGAVLLAASATGSAAGGLLLGASFGIGAVLVPAVVFGLLVAHLGDQVRGHLVQWQGALERVAAALIIALGAATAGGWLRP